MSTRELSVRITGDPRSLSRAFRSVDRDMGRMEKASDRLRSSFRAFGRAAALGAGLAAAGFAAGAVKATKAASDLEEALNKSNETFEAAGPAMERWASTAATSLGMSKAAALENAASIGAMLKPMGVAPQRAAEMSRKMAELASDMASFNNEDPTEMLDRIRAGLSGESEPLKRYGAVLSETRVKQHAWKVGLAEAGQELTEQQKIQARYSLLLKDTADQQGDFARTSDGLANAQRIARARLEDLSATMGRVFVPIAAKALGVALDFLGVVQDRWPQIRAVGERVFDRLGEAVGRIKDPILAARDAMGQLFGRFQNMREQGESFSTSLATIIGMGLSQVPWGSVAEAIGRGIAVAFATSRTITAAIATGIKAAVAQIDGRDVLAGMLKIVSEAMNALFSPSFWRENFAAIFATVTIFIPIAKLFKLPGANVLFDYLSKPLFGALRLVGTGLGRLMGAAGKAAVGQLVSEFGSALPSVALAGELILQRIIRAFGPLKKLLAKIGTEAAVALAGAIITTVGTLLRAVGERAADLGRAIVRGIAAGIKSVAGEIRDAILSAIPGPLRRLLGGGGPSTAEAAADIGRFLDRARGGTIPGPRGRAVPIVAHSGEVVLNPAQQRIVGIDRIVGALRATGGIVGGRSFAAGGLVDPIPGGRWAGSPADHGARALGDWQSDNAWDVFGPVGMPVRAVHEGTIPRITPPGRGPQFNADGVYLSTPSGTWWYRHINAAVRVGQRVAAGQIIGRIAAGTAGGPHLHLASDRGDPARARGGRAPAVQPTGASPGLERSESSPPASPRDRLIAVLRGAGITRGVGGVASRVLQAGADVSSAVGTRLGASSGRGERSVRAAGRAAAAEARAAGLPPDEVAAAAQAAERKKQGDLLRADIRRVDASLRDLGKRWAKLRRDLLRIKGPDRGSRKQARDRIKAAMRQNRRERDELLETRAAIVDELKELNEEIAQERYEESFAGEGGDAGEGPPTEADFADAAMAQAALTPGLDDDLSAARTIEDIARREYEAALASGDPRRIADAARAYLGARQQRESVEEQIKATRENTDALRELNRSFGGSVVFGYRGQDFVLGSLAPPSSDRLVGMEV